MPRRTPDNSLKALVAKGRVTDVSASAIQRRLHEVKEAKKRFLQEATRDNTERAYQVGVNFFWAWSFMYFGVSRIEYPVPQEAIEAYLISMLVKTDKTVDNGLVRAGIKKEPGLLKLSTVKSRIWALEKAHREFCPDLSADYVKTREIKKILKSASDKPVHTALTQADALTRDHLKTLLGFLEEDTPRNILMRAVLTTGFSSGGRRISELVNMETADCSRWESKDAPGWMYTIALRKTKTRKGAQEAREVPVRDRAAIYLADWLSLRAQRGIDGGKLFRSVRPDGFMSKKGMSAEWFSKRLKELVKTADISDAEGRPLRISPHSLRSGFVTQANIDGVIPGDGMELSGHASIASYTRYHRTQNVKDNPAGKLLSDT